MKTSTLLKLIVLFVGMSIQTLPAQDNASLRKKGLFPQLLASFTKNYPQEKVYLHFDNSAYYLGENIWFKAYIVQADQNSFTQLSKILYVDLVSAEGYVIETQKLKIENGQCHGTLKPIGKSNGGFYEIRAYTSYMLNFGSENYFSRVFPVYDKPKTLGEFNYSITDSPNSQRIPQIRNSYEQSARLAVTFFPEGGNLIEGLHSKIAFKATAKNGESVNVAGSVYNEKDERLVDFATEHLGMGNFELTPTSGKYWAKVKFNNREYKFELPAAMRSGYVMTIDNEDDRKINIQVQKNTNAGNEPLGLCISSRGVIYDTETVDLSTKTSATLSFPKIELPSGVCQITLYKVSGEVLSERLLFINHHDEIKIAMSQYKSTYKPFEKIDLSFHLNNPQNTPAETTFSLAVRDAATSSNNPNSENIMTNLLLSSEVRGYIENPGYYFQSEDNNRKRDLDLLLLTQGWSRYSWKQITKENAFTLKYPIEKELDLYGSVASLYQKKRMKNIEITMVLNSDSTSQRGKCKTDSAGNFNFVLKDFNGTGKLALQSKENGKRKETYIMLNRDLNPDLKAYAFAEINLAQYLSKPKNQSDISDITTGNDSIERIQAAIEKKLMMDKKVFMLKEVTVKEKSKPITVSVKYDVARELDKRIDAGEWIPSSVSLFLHFNCKYYNASTGLYKGKSVIFIREVIVPQVNNDQEDIVGLSDNMNGGQMPYLDEVESISFIEDFSSIQRMYNGIIDPSSYVIALIQCKSDYKKEPYGVRYTTFYGYSRIKEFYSPQYDKVILPDEKDYRRTIYWNPNVRTDKDGTATVSFYNNGSFTSLNVSAETVTANGMIGHLNK
jgi:hypothetical protein